MLRYISGLFTNPALCIKYFFSGYYWYCGYAVSFNLIQTLVASVWDTLSLEGKAKTIILYIEYIDLTIYSAILVQ